MKNMTNTGLCFKGIALVIWGVSGCGKSTIASALAKKLNLRFFDADDYHSVENKIKMSSETALNDRDRKIWLEELSNLINEHHDEGVVLACSALKQAYRDQLRIKSKSVFFIHLSGSYELISSRMKSRSHFMPVSLLNSQFAILEQDRESIFVDIDKDVSGIVDEILEKLNFYGVSVK